MNLRNAQYRKLGIFQSRLFEVRLGRERLARCLDNKVDDLEPFVNGGKYYMRFVGFSPTVKTVEEISPTHDSDR